MSMRATVWASPMLRGWWLHIWRGPGGRFRPGDRRALHLCLEHDPSGRSVEVL